MFERLLGNQKFDNHLGDGVKAYQNHKSRETTLISLVEDWKLAVDNRLLEGILSTDMPKAFDSLHPPIMPRKLLMVSRTEHWICYAVTWATA